MNRWNENWDVITPIFKFSAEVRKAFYTTNTIESLNLFLPAAEPSEERVFIVTGIVESTLSGSF